MIYLHNVVALADPTELIWLFTNDSDDLIAEATAGEILEAFNYVDGEIDVVALECDTYHRDGEARVWITLDGNDDYYIADLLHYLKVQ